jgi:hypothetical protein
MKILSIPLAAVVLASCAPMAPPEARSPQAEAKLQEVLTGMVPGTPMTCLPPHRTNEMITIDDNTILFRRGQTVYRNDPVGGCPGLASGFYTLVTRSTGSGLCRGDIAQVADVSSGMTVGSCALGDFVPYTRPGP